MSEVNKQNIRLSRHIDTFRKTQCNVWNDRPHLINFKRCIESKWEPSVHNLENEQLIIHITATQRNFSEANREDKNVPMIRLNIFNYYQEQEIGPD